MSHITGAYLVGKGHFALSARKVQSASDPNAGGELPRAEKRFILHQILS